MCFPAKRKEAQEGEKPKQIRNGPKHHATSTHLTGEAHRPRSVGDGTNLARPCQGRARPPPCQVGPASWRQFHQCRGGRCAGVPSISSSKPICSTYKRGEEFIFTTHIHLSHSPLLLFFSLDISLGARLSYQGGLVS
jgi:hypothetical protein